MKISKKIIISSLSTALGVSLVGAISGTVAWYQYNTAVRTSIIGMNVAETGVLEISATSATTGYTRDLVTSDLGLADTRITPITWASGADQTATGALSGTAYKNPNAALNRAATNPGSYAEVYQEAAATDYIQYTVYLRGKTVSNDSTGFTQTAEKVYLTDFTLTDVDGEIVEGMRVHLACYNDSASGSPDKNYLISKSAKTTLPLYGLLDCDGDVIADRLGGYEWQDNRDDVVTYGQASYTQTTMIPSTLINTPDANGVITDNAAKLLVTTPTTADHASKIVITIWYEGWDNYKKATVDNITASQPAEGTNLAAYYTDRNCKVAATGTADNSGKTYYQKADAEVPMWSGYKTDGASFRLGMTFAVSSNAFND